MPQSIFGWELVDHLAGHDLPPVGLGEHGARRRGEPVTLVQVDQPVAHRDRGPLRLDHHTRDRADLGAQPVCGLDDVGEPTRSVVLDLALVRAPDVETAAARHHQVVDSHQLLHDGPVAAADHAHRAALRQRPHRVPHAVGDHAIPGAVDEQGQHPVVVEEHHQASPGQPLDEPAVIGREHRADRGPSMSAPSSSVHPLQRGPFIPLTYPITKKIDTKVTYV